MTKDQIIEAIKRVARESEGKPPGMKRFRTLTGIGEHDWRGKYWARWGDALIAAGFAPNTWSVGYGETFILEKYMALTSELGRVPTMSEWELKARSDRTFPSEQALRRLGPKRRLIASALALAQKDARFHSIAPVFAAAASSDTKSPVDRPPKVATGFVYLLKSGRHYKIGRTNSLGRREWELGIKIPIPPKTIHSIETDDPVGVEAYWHRRFADKRGEGEWFDLSAEDVQAFKRWKRIV